MRHAPARWRATLTERLRGHGDRLALAGAGLLLAAALANPTIEREQALFDHIVVLDITQSMDVPDMAVDGRPASRLAAARHALHRALLALPCGSRLGWGVFTEHRSVLLLEPVEVCEHLGELRATLARIDGRMAWAGNSEVAKGLHNALRQLPQLPGKPSLLFVTDGHEAPPLDARQRPSFDGTPGEVAGFIVGMGGLQPAPIPRSDPLGRPLGLWQANEVMQVDPYAQGRGGSATGDGMVSDAPPTPAPGATPGSEHLSSLREGYLRLLAGETGLTYARAPDAPAMAHLLTAPELTRPVPARQPLQGLLAGTACVVLMARHAGLAWRRWLRIARTRWSWRRRGDAAVNASPRPGTRR